MKKDKNEVVELTGTEKVAGKIESFFSKNWKAVVAVCAVIVVVVAIIAVFSFVSAAKQEKQFNEVFKLEQSFTDITSKDSASEEFKTSVTAFNTAADSLIASSKGYPQTKAQYLKGLVAMEAGDWNSAADLFNAVAQKSGKNYLAPLALLNAAVAVENAGSQDKALELYKKIWDDFGIDCPESPKALFNVARLYEAKGDKELAKATYSQLVDAFLEKTGSEYARLAQARLVTL